MRIETAASSRVSKQERIGNVAYMRPSWLTEDLLEVQCLSARRVTGGTGKYQGMDQTGKFNLAVQKPSLPGQLGGIFHWWGNYKMR